MSFKKKFVLSILFLVFLLLSSMDFCNAQSSRVVLIIVDKVSFNELQSNAFFNDLMQKSSIGLMNVNGVGSATTYKSYASIGSGTRSDAQRDNCNAVIAAHPVDYIFYRRTGQKVEQNNIVNLNINSIKALNENNSYHAHIGRLGELLRENDKKIALIANSSTDDTQINPAILIAMDEYGIVDGGVIDEQLIIEDFGYPYSMKTNYNFIEDFIKNNYNEYDFWIIDTSDLSRLERYQYFLTEHIYQEQKQKIITDIGSFIQRLLPFFDANDTTLIIITPFYSVHNNAKGDKLTPVLIYKKGLNPGVLSSDTTRRKGIIANIDIAPSILNEFGLESVGMTGHKIYNIEQTNNVKYIHDLNIKTIQTSKSRRPILTGYALYQILLILFFLASVVFAKYFDKKIYKLLEYFVLASMIVPLVLLIEPMFFLNSKVSKVLFIVLATILIVVLIKFLINKSDDRLFFLSGLIYWLIVVDLLTGGMLNKNSIMGYDPIIGARYYGIGNEYGGLFLGASLLFIGLGIHNRYFNKLVSYFLLFFTFVICVSSELGANFGLSVAAAVSIFFIIFYILKININTRNVFIFFALCIMALALFIMVDIYFLERDSHISNIFIRARQDGVGLIYDAALRKINVNIKLIKNNIWSRVLISFLFLLTFLFYRPVGLLKKVMSKYRIMSIFWYANIIASVVGLLVNDSGVVFAATCMICLVMSILYIIIGYIPQM